MTVDPPIVVLGPPRSGTSLVAGLFARHGVWTGTCREPNENNPLGFYESKPLKEVMLRHWGPLVHKAVVGKYVPRIRREIVIEIVADGYKGGPWLHKMSTMYWQMYRDMDPTWVLCRRHPKATKKSGMKTGYNANPKSVDLHYEVADEIRDQHGGVDVDVDAVIAREYDTLEAAFEAAGIELDRSIVDKFVDPELWHY